MRARAALEHIHAESATSSVEADLEAIRALIRGFPGGLETLNEVVKQRLRRCFAGSSPRANQGRESTSH